MKKVTILALLMVFNLGSAASELIFQDGFESGWPNAWAEAVGWSPYFVKDSTDKLVGPVVGWWTYVHESDYSPEVAIVAVRIGGDKVLLRVHPNHLRTDGRVWFFGPLCTGQAYVCTEGCAGESVLADKNRMRELTGVTHRIGPGWTVYKAEQQTESINVSVLSYYETHGSVANAASCAALDTTLSKAIPAEYLEDLNTLFTPPFTVE